MAEFTSFGLDELMLSLEEIAAIPEEVQDEILNAQADVTLAAQRDTVRAYGIYDEENHGRHVADSLKKSKVKIRRKDKVRVIYITPTGTRRRGGKRRWSAPITTRNAEILFINEYGKKGQKARPAIRDANEKSANRATEAALEVYDRWLKSKDL